MRGIQRLMIAGAALAGLILAHVLDYVLLVPDGAHRDDLLFETGHGYMPLALAAAGVAGVAALGAGLVSGARDGRMLRHPTFALAALQSGGFLILESAERIMAGAPLDQGAARIMLAGIALQAVVAAVSARVLTAMTEAGETLARRAFAPRRLVRMIRPALRVAPVRGAHASSRPVRGPPLASITL